MKLNLGFIKLKFGFKDRTARFIKSFSSSEVFVWDRN